MSEKEALMKAIKAEESAKVETGGWININRDTFPCNSSIFYPSTWMFYAKPPTVQDIKDYSSMDESDAESVNRSTIDMIRNNIKIVDKRGSKQYTLDPTKHILNMHKLFFILFIQTIGDTQSIKYKYKCDKCQTENYAQLLPNNLVYSEISEKLNDYIDKSRGCISIKVKDIKDTDKIEYRPLTISEAEDLEYYFRYKHKMNTSVAKREMFVNMLSYIRPIDQQFDYSEMYDSYISMNREKFSFIMNLHNKMLDVKPILTLSCECDACGSSTQPNIQIPDGAKSIFINDDIDKYFA